MVWLNSDSRLKIPTAFVGNERRVFLSGEAYFDVVKNDRKPFIVETDLGNIKVYGTEFNVKRYSGFPHLRFSNMVPVNNSFFCNTIPIRACNSFR